MDHFPASTLARPDAAGPAAHDDARDLPTPREVVFDAGRPGRLRRGLSRVRRSLFWVLVSILASGLIGGLAYLQTWPPLAVVESGSMVPTIQIGDVEVLKHLDGPPRVGEIIVVHVPEWARTRYGYPPVITHRVHAISRDGQVTTKGDALKTVDPFTTPENTVTEKVLAVIPDAGRVFGFFTSSWGMLWLAAGLLLLLGLPLLERRSEREQDERETLATLQTQLEALAIELSGRSGGPDPAPTTAPTESLEAELRALVDQAASTQRTLADAAAALQEQQAWLKQELGTAPVVPAPEPPPEQEPAVEEPQRSLELVVREHPQSVKLAVRETPPSLELALRDCAGRSVELARRVCARRSLELAVRETERSRELAVRATPQGRELAVLETPRSLELAVLETPRSLELARRERAPSAVGPPACETGPPKLELAPRATAPPKLELAPRDAAPPKLVLVRHDCPPPKLVIVGRESAPPGLLVLSHNSAPPALVILSRDCPPPRLILVRHESAPPKLTLESRDCPAPRLVLVGHAPTAGAGDEPATAPTAAPAFASPTPAPETPSAVAADAAAVARRGLRNRRAASAAAVLAGALGAAVAHRASLNRSQLP